MPAHPEVRIGPCLVLVTHRGIRRAWSDRLDTGCAGTFFTDGLEAGRRTGMAGNHASTRVLAFGTGISAAPRAWLPLAA